MTPTQQILPGDCREVLAAFPLPRGQIRLCLSSPPYWGQRAYRGGAQEIGQEAKADCLAWTRGEPPCGGCYVCSLREVFARVRELLAPDGSLWLNLGEVYSNAGKGGAGDRTRVQKGTGRKLYAAQANRGKGTGLKHKEMSGLPWAVARALGADGWILRAALPWLKHNSQPESVVDRPALGHEYFFLFSKRAQYYYDRWAVVQPASEQEGAVRQFRSTDFWQESLEQAIALESAYLEHLKALRTGEGMLLSPGGDPLALRFHPGAFPGEHFAVFPPKLIQPLILASTSAGGCCPRCYQPWVREQALAQKLEKGRSKRGLGEKTFGKDPQPISQKTRLHQATYLGESRFLPSCECGEPPLPETVLDPFSGMATTGQVARDLGRSYVGIELNGEYAQQSEWRLLGARMDGGKQQLNLLQALEGEPNG